MFGWLVGSLVCSLVGCLVAWFVRWFVRWLVAWLVAWLVVEFTNLTNPCSGLMKLPGGTILQRTRGSEKLCLSFSHENCWG